MKKEVQKKRTKKSAWKPIEFMAGEHGALDRQIFRKKCEDPKFVARCIAENLKWRRGEVPYAFNEDPKKNAPMPLCPQALSLIEESAIIHLNGHDKGYTASDIEAIKYAIFVIEANTGDCFGEDECNGKRCYKHCGDRNCCMLRAKLMLSRILKKIKKSGGKGMKCKK